MKPQEQTYSKSRRLKNQIKAVVTNPYNIIVLIAVVLLVYLIVLPLLDMIATTFELAQRDIRCTEEEGYLILPILSDEIAAQLTRFLAENRLGVVRLEERQKSLEDIFLELTGKAVSL